MECVLVLLCLLVLLQSATPQGCLYQYLRQPPSSLEPLCNPYAPPATLGVQCQAAVPSSEAAAVEILWFYNNQRITGSFPAVIEVSPLEEAMGRSMITSTLAFDGDNFNDTFQGNYFCQIVVDGNNSTAPSNSLLLEAEDLYIIFTNTPCRTDYFSENITCVGNRSLLPLATALATTDEPDTSTSISFAPTATTTTTTSTTTMESSMELVYVVVAFTVLFGATILLLGGGLCILCYKRKAQRTVQNAATHGQVQEVSGVGTFAMKENEVYMVSGAIGGVERMEMGENEAYAVSGALGGVERMEMGENEAYAVSRALGGVERMEMGENEAYAIDAHGVLNEPSYECIQ